MKLCITESKLINRLTNISPLCVVHDYTASDNKTEPIESKTNISAIKSNQSNNFNVALYNIINVNNIMYKNNFIIKRNNSNKNNLLIISSVSQLNTTNHEITAYSMHNTCVIKSSILIQQIV